MCIAAGPHLWAEGSCLEVICERDTWQQPWFAAEEAEARKQLQEVRRHAVETAGAARQVTAMGGCGAFWALCVASASLRAKCCLEHSAAAQSIQNPGWHVPLSGLQRVSELSEGRQNAQ